MIGKLALKTAEKFVKNNNTLYDKIEIYQYGFFVLFSNIFFLIITSIIGVILDVFLQSIIFFFTFFSIRQFAGGYHASTETRCEIFSTLSILACIVVIKLSKTYNFQTVLLLITILSAVCILVFCPIDTHEKPLSDKEFGYFRKISWTILLVIVTLTVISYIFKWNFVFSPCCMSLVLESILISAGKIKRLLDNKKTKI